MQKPDWRCVGEEPDYRFTLANERTFLAWIRTALAILASGVLLEQFATKLKPQLAVTTLAVVLCMLATVLSVTAYRRWRANEIAMRQKKRLPIQSTSFTLAVGLFVVGMSIVGTLLWTVI